MSAFLVANMTINKILFVLEYEIRRSVWFKRECEEKLELDLTADWKTILGQKMLELNLSALCYRYGDKKRDVSYEFEPARCTLVEGYKGMQCWLYQCCEGEAPKSKLYRFFNEVALAQVADDIVTRMPEYAAAEWG